MNARGLRVRYKVWLEHDGQVALSDWRVQLLDEIDRRGSLAEAARHIGVPYKTAWYKLKEMEKRLGEALLASASGGSRGGGMTLTEAGRETIRQYQQLTAGLDELLAARFAEAFGTLPVGKSAAAEVPETASA
ncbi:MAG TPA: LysR family transcriptional regulator [Chloroflexota bacterium]|nr:LysR family transcriptional regulator [Chloroflexota bacterium]